MRAHRQYQSAFWIWLEVRDANDRPATWKPPDGPETTAFGFGLLPPPGGPPRGLSSEELRSMEPDCKARLGRNADCTLKSVTRPATFGSGQ